MPSDVPKEVLDDVTYPSPDLNPDQPDVPRKTLKTLAQWAVDLSKSRQAVAPPGTSPSNLSKNAYDIDTADAPDTVVFSLSDPVPGAADPDFMAGFGANDPNIPHYRKGSRNADGVFTVSGNELLPTAGVGTPNEVGSGLSETTLDPRIESYVQTPILKNNKWTMGSQRAANDSIRIKGTDRSKGQLANVGVTLTTRASSELGSFDSGYDVSSGTAEANALLPGWTQMGAKRVELSELEALSALNDSVDGPIEETIAPGGSWGQMNNPLDQYSGISAFGMTALSVALFASTVAVVKVFSSTLSLVAKSNSSTELKPGDFRDGERLHPGVYGPRRGNGGTSGFPPMPLDSNFAANLLGIRQTLFGWSASVEAGMLAFYGSDKTSLRGVQPSDFKDMVSRAVEDPGFYSVISRGIIRSGVEIVDKLKDMANSPNLVSGIKNLIGFFDVIKRSKFMAAMNAFAAIGERSLMAQTDASKPSETGRIPGLDASPNTIASNTKSRLSRIVGDQSNSREEPTLKLAWASNRAISVLNTPNVLRGTLLQAITNTAPAALMGVPTDPMSRTIHSHVDGRLPIEVVEWIESVLDYEYVPFYFHDLRTNEIISFHAFITSLSDDYSPDWETSEAPGRVDPVKIYKSTARKISIGFQIVATSQVDFDEMWVKINKLVTLVYPQYTKGRTVQDSSSDSPDYRFTLPFSQLPSASPLVRIRLGDLFKSNYSKFALARLFGMGSAYTEGTRNDQKLLVNKTTFLTEKLKGTEEQKLSEISRWTENFEKIKSSGVVFLVPASSLSNESIITENMTTSAAADMYESLLFLKRMSGTLVPVTLDTQVTSGQLYNVKVAIGNPRVAKYEIRAEDRNYINRLLSAKLCVPASDLTLPPSEISYYVSGGKDANAGSKATEFQSFMKEENNALVKSFKETGGKGLAGVIESLNFDWYDRVLWETDVPGSKAPKSCKVTLTFSPIHDIPPGIDSNGYNRAAVYPVGSSEGNSSKIQPGRPSFSAEGIKEAIGNSTNVSSDVHSRKA